MQSQKTTCLKCDERGNVLVCSNSICPIVLHESCMATIPWFDDSGRFYCPYCFYKQALDEYHLTKEKALLANRKLVSFLGTRTSRSNCTDQRNFKCLKRKKPDASTIIENRDTGSCTNVDCNGVQQPMQVKGGHQSDSRFLETLCSNQRQPGLGKCLGKGNGDEKLTKECLVTEQQVGVLGKEQTHEVPKDISISQLRENNAIMMEEKANEISHRTCQDDGSVIRPMKVDLGFANQSSKVGKYQCRKIEGQVNLNSQINATYGTNEDNVSMIDKISISPLKELEETSKAVGQCCGGQVKKEKTQEVSQEACVFVTNNENAVAKPGGLVEEKDTSVEDGNFISCEMVENSENADQPCEAGKNCFGSVDVTKIPIKTLIDDIGLTRVDDLIVTHELGNSKKEQEAKELLEGYQDRVQNVKETHTELQSRQINDKKVMAEESDVDSYSAVHSEYFPRDDMDNKSDDQLEDQCQRNDEEPKWLKLWKFVPPITGTGSASVSHEELDIADSASSNTNYLEHANNSRENTKFRNKSRKIIQHGKLSGYSETEVEEYEVSRSDTSRHKVESIKHIQQSTVLPATRRRKLPWTGEEIEMLKAGVHRFSLTTNKNLSWLKIMDFGRHVFDGTRTPNDLKEKWKNLRGKGNANI